jgi:hypothetical protein
MYKLGKDEQMNPKVWRKEKILKVTAEIKQKNEKKIIKPSLSCSLKEIKKKKKNLLLDQPRNRNIQITQIRNER